MRRVTTLASALLAGALVLTACGGSSDLRPTRRRGSGSSSSAPKSDLKVGLAYDIGGRGDQSFNDAAAAGLDKAKADLGIDGKELEAAAAARPTPPRRSACALLASAATTRSSRSASPTPARSRGRQGLPGHQVRHHRRRGSGAAPNIANLTFAEEQGSYLVGVAAGAEDARPTTSASSAASTCR